jgi:hypothetical protein
MTPKLIALAGAALLAPLPAQAQQWYFASTNTEYSGASFVDKDSITGTGQFRRARVAVVTYDDPDTGAVSALIEYDCKSDRFRMIENISYHPDGTKFRPENTEDEPWHETRPNTFYRPARDFVCSGGTTLAADRNFGSEIPIKPARDYMRSEREAQAAKPAGQ